MTYNVYLIFLSINVLELLKIRHKLSVYIGSSRLYYNSNFRPFTHQLLLEQLQEYLAEYCL